MTDPKKRSLPASSVAEKVMKGWTAVKKAAQDKMDNTGASAPRTDSVLPSIDVLKNKYLGTTVSLDAAQKSPVDSHSETVTVESSGMRKTVGVQGSKILWRQG